MNIKRIISWASFIIVIGLIVWGMIAASNKANRASALLPLPDKIVSTDQIRGNATSTITLVEYSDFQCPACYLYFPIVEKIYAEYSSKVRFVYRHFPLSQHANALPAAYASEAAAKQGKFWEMYNIIFTNHDLWENSTSVKTIFSGYAEKIGLDMNKYATDVESKEIRDKVDAELKGGIKAGINSTPTFYLNGKKIQSPQGYDAFKKLLDETNKTTIKL